MVTVIKPPDPIILPQGSKSIFLAGSIDQGKAEDWQTRMINACQDVHEPTENIIILNPRRDDWNDGWVQRMENPYFREQVEWELDGMERATQIIMYLVAGTKSPISLLELGLAAGKYPWKISVYCEPGFWREGNVEILCKRYGIYQH